MVAIENEDLRGFANLGGLCVRSRAARCQAERASSPSCLGRQMISPSTALRQWHRILLGHQVDFPGRFLCAAVELLTAQAGLVNHQGLTHEIPVFCARILGVAAVVFLVPACPG